MRWAYPGERMANQGGSRDDVAPPLDEQDVAPDAVVPPQPLAAPDHAETAVPVQREAGGILGEDAGLDRPDPRLLGPGHELREQQPPDPAAAEPRGDVDAVLGDASVDAPVGDGRERRPADDGPVAAGDETWIRHVGGIPRFVRRDRG